jgi:PiT family inorganic phosphate transporter
MEQGSPFGGINWHKAAEVGMALVLSPLVGFGLAAALLMLAKRLIPARELYEPPHGDRPPPWWIRALLIGTCTGVSFAHGSNDGQKGMGLIMLVLIGIVPAAYALDMGASSAEITATAAAARRLEQELSAPELTAMMNALKEQHVANTRVARMSRGTAVAAAEVLESPLVEEMIDPFPGNDVVLATLDPLPLVRDVLASLDGRTSFQDLGAEDRWELRTRLVELGASVRTLLRQFGDRLADDRRQVLKSLAGQLTKPVEYVPEWVVMGVALCLGIGTMFGWERIVVTVGEKIGKTHLTYAQGGAAELVAASTIAMADSMGMPVSTTHVLSSGVAGTMWANKSGIQPGTVREIALAWVLTLPVAMALAGGLYWLATAFVG